MDNRATNSQYSGVLVVRQDKLFILITLVCLVQFMENKDMVSDNHASHDLLHTECD